MARSKEMDLTTGNPFRSLLKFAIPVILGNLFQLFYTLADSVIVGKTLGADSLAAVGSTSIIIYFVFCFINGFTGGFGICLGQKCGAKDEKGMRKSVAVSTLLSIAFTVVLTLICCLLSHQILRWMQIPADISGEAYDYMFVVLLGTGATVFYNMISNMLRALGDSKTPLYFLILAALLNIVLDLTFIIVLHMGVPGAAWATITAQGVSGVLCLIYIIKYVPELRLKADDWRFRSEIAKKEILVGIPMGLQYSITAIGTMMVQSALNILGSYAVAAFTAGNKIENIFTQAYVAIGTTMATYNAQNIGARKLDRVRQGFNSAHIIGITYAIVTGVIIFFFGKYLSYLFISDNAAEVIPMVDTYVKCVAVFFIPLHFVNALRNGIQGMGYGLLPMLAGVAELAGRGITAMIAAAHKSYFGACMASPMAWVLAGGLLIIMYFYVMKDMKRRLGL